MAPFEQIQVEVLRLRDQMTGQGLTLVDHAVRLVKLETEMTGLEEKADTLATKEQVTNLGRTTEAQVRHLGELVEAQMGPIRRGAYWLIGIVGAGVIGAVLALIFR